MPRSYRATMMQGGNPEAGVAGIGAEITSVYCSAGVWALTGGGGGGRMRRCLLMRLDFRTGWHDDGL